MKKHLLVIPILLGLALNLTGQTWTEKTVSSSADGASSVHVVDIDNDGDIDILSASYNDDKVALYKNDGSENFAETIVSDSADGARSVFVIDIDGDSNLDIVSASFNDDKIAWYKNNGSEIFTESLVSDSADGARSVFAADIDGDTKQDIISASALDDKIAWYKNGASQVFTENVVSTTVNSAWAVFAANIDGVNKTDILTASFADKTVAWWQNNGSGSFTDHTVSNTASYASSVYAADVNGDGNMDILSAAFADNEIAWYQNDGSQNFTKHPVATNAGGAWSVFAVDVDKDGDTDILAAAFNADKILWYENDGAESFTEHIISSTADGASCVYATDMDGDGDIDIVAASYNNNKITWYEQGFDGTTYYASAWDNGTPATGVNARIAQSYSGTGFTCNNITINTGQTLTVSSGVLEIEGELTNSGTLVIASGALAYKDGKYAPAGTYNAGNLLDDALVAFAPIATSATNIKWNAISGANYRLDLSTDPSFGSFVSADIDKGTATTHTTDGTPTYARLRISCGGWTGPNSPTIILKNAPANALDFDGTDDYVSLEGTSTISGSFTVEAWVKPDVTGTISVLSSRSTAYEFGFDLLLTGGTTVRTDIGDGSAWLKTNASGTYAYTTDRWLHVAAVVDAGTYSVYANGIQVGTGSYSGTALLRDANRLLVIGNNKSVQHFNGQIDEVRIWNTARTQNQIQANMYTSLTGSVADLVSSYNFDLQSGSALYDCTGTNHGTLTNMDDADWTESFAMAAPANNAASALTETSFTANWAAATTGTVEKYLLDVSTSEDFSSFVSGYQNLDCGTNTSQAVSGLTAATYYYRVRAQSATVGDVGAWHYSSPVEVLLPGIFVTGTLSDYSTNMGTASASKSFTIEGHSLGANNVNIAALSGFEYSTNNSTFSPSLSLSPSSGTLAITTIYVRLAGTTTGLFGGNIVCSCAAAASDRNVAASGKVGIKAPGNALNFDGTEDYVNIGSVITGGSAYTKEAWVKTTGTTPHSFNIISSAGAPFYLNVADAYKLTAGNGANISVVTDTDAWVHNRWTHIAVSYDGASTMKLYKNGKLVATNTGSPGYTAESMAIGQLGLAGGNFFNGQIDEVRIWNTALSQTAIRNMMYAELTGNETNLLAYYDFNLVSGTTLYDLAGYDNNGTLVNMTGAEWTESYAMVVPTLLSGSAVGATKFTARWTAPTTGTVGNYLLDISTASDFSSFITGYEAKNCGTATTKAVTGLELTTKYYYRVRAQGASVGDVGAWHFTDTTSVTTTELPNPGNALVFDGTNEYVSLAGTDAVSGTFTVEAWVKPLHASNTLTIISSRNAATDYGFDLKLTGGNTIRANIGDGTSQTTVADATYDYTTNEWFHLACAVSGGTYTLYANGSQIGTGSYTGTALLRDASHLLSIGYNADGNNEYFKGQIDEVRIWNTALNLSTLRTNIYKELTTTGSNLLAYYDFDQIKGTTLPDKTGNASDGTLTNMEDADWASSYAMVAPVPAAANPIGATSFTAKWAKPATGTAGGFVLEVSTDNTFASGVTTYQLANTATSKVVTGLDLTTTYYYRVYTKGGSTDTTVAWHYNSPLSATTTELPDPGNALDFDGVNDSVSIGNIIPNGSSYTKEAWVITRGTTLGSFNVISSVGAPFYLDVADNYKLTAGNGASITVVADPNAWVHNRWTHIAVSYDGANTMKLYKNGILVATSTGSPAYVAEHITIGGYSLSPNFFNGQIDEVRIWSTVRSQADIQGGMFAELNGNETGLLAYYDFDQIKGTTLPDKTSNNHDGSMTNMDDADWVTSYAMVVPVATAASSLTSTGFTANWTAPATGTAGSYLLDVSTASDFASFVTGYEAKNCGTGTSQAVTGLDPTTTYYYRVYAQGGSADTMITWHYNDPIEVTTLTPTINTAGTLSDFVTALGVASVSQNVTLTGSNLIDDVTVTAPSGYEVSANDSTFSADITLAPSSGTLASKTVYVRLKGTSAGSISGNVVCASTSATSKQVAAEGEVVNMVAPGYALDFDGTEDYVSMAGTDTVSGTFTVEVWVKPTDASSTINLISSRNASHDYSFDLKLSGGNTIHANIGDGTAWLLQQDFSFTYTTNQWCHIAVVVEPGSYTIYANGAQIATDGLMGAAILKDADNPLALGYNPVGGSEYFKGQLDEVRIWGDARTEAEIQANMYNELTGGEGDLAAYYNFDLAKGSALYDLVGTDHGTLNNMEDADWTTSYAMVVPVPTDATSISSTGFTANWTAPAIGTVNNYLLDVSTDEGFSSFVSGYQGLASSTTSATVTGLTAATVYYYRVYAQKAAASDTTGAWHYSSPIEVTLTPEITATGTLEAFTAARSNASVAQSFSLKGRNLVADVKVNALAGFEYSTDNSTFSADLTLSPTLGTLADTTIWVQLISGTNGVYSGNIDCSSTDADTVQVAVTGEVGCVWSGTAWIPNAPATGISAIIEGNYSGVGFTCNNLIVNSGQTLEITSGVLVVEGTLTNNGTVTIAPGASLYDNGTLAGTGTYNFKCTLGANAWHQVAVPMASYTTNSVFAPAAFYTYLETGTARDNAWNKLSAGASLNLGKGYLMRFPSGATLTFTGTPNTGATTVASGLARANEGYHMVGNPYPSAIDWDQAGWTKSNLSTTIWIYDNGAGNYMSWNGSAGSITDGVIAPLQGFFVQATSAGASLACDNQVRLSSNAGSFYKKAPESDIASIKVYAIGQNGFNDQAIYYQRQGNEDNATKLFGMEASAPQVYFMADDANYSILATDAFTESTVLKVGFTTWTNGTYTLSATQLNLPIELEAMVTDEKTGASFALSALSSYAIDYRTTDAELRFTIRFTKRADIITSAANTLAAQVAMYSYAGKVILSSTNAFNGTVRIVSANGVVVANSAVSFSGRKELDMDLPAGIYAVQLRAENGKTLTKTIAVE